MFKNRALQVQMVKKNETKQVTGPAFDKEDDIKKIHEINEMAKDQVEHVGKVVVWSAVTIIAAKTLSQIILHTAK